MNKYIVEQLDHKGHWVRIRPVPESVTEEFFPNISIPTLTEAEALDIDLWIVDNNLGRRMSFDQWKLRSSSAVTAVRLKWS